MVFRSCYVNRVHAFSLCPENKCLNLKAAAPISNETAAGSTGTEVVLPGPPGGGGCAPAKVTAPTTKNVVKKILNTLFTLVDLWNQIIQWVSRFALQYKLLQVKCKLRYCCVAKKFSTVCCNILDSSLARRSSQIAVY